MDGKERLRRRPVGAVDEKRPVDPSADEREALAECGQTNVPFSDNDRLTLRLAGSFATGPARFTWLVLTFNRRVDDGAPHRGTVAGLDGTGDQHAELDGIRLTLLGGEAAIDARAIVTQATVTALAFPTAEGQPLSARVALEFDDGTSFDVTVTGKLKSYPAACGEPKLSQRSRVGSSSRSSSWC